VSTLEPYLIEPIWQQFKALLPQRRTDHPLGCHRLRIPERVDFEKLVESWCSAVPTAVPTIGSPMLPARRVPLGADGMSGSSSRGAGAAQAGLPRCLRPPHRLGALGGRGGLLRHQGTEGGGKKAGSSPVDRGKRGIKRSMAVDARGIPGQTCVQHLRPCKPSRLAAVGPHPNGGDRDARLSARGDERAPRERGYDSKKTHERLEELGLRACYELGRKPHRNADSTSGLIPSRSPFSAFLSRF
jgi:hypothetical protein